MSRFADVLSREKHQLDIPEPARSRILLEMASDLEDSFQHFESQGVGDDKARRLAEEAFGTSRVSSGSSSRDL